MLHLTQAASTDSFQHERLILRDERLDSLRSQLRDVVMGCDYCTDDHRRKLLNLLGEQTGLLLSWRQFQPRSDITIR